MHTTIITQKATRLGRASWLEELFASLVSFLAVAQPQPALQCAGRQPGKASYTACALSQSARPFAMLVVSDVRKGSSGLVL